MVSCGVGRRGESRWHSGVVLESSREVELFGIRDRGETIASAWVRPLWASGPAMAIAVDCQPSSGKAVAQAVEEYRCEVGGYT